MPYITRARRAFYERALRPLCDRVAAGASDGDLNYVLTSIVLAWLPDDPHYSDYARAISALECCKLELMRTKLGPYENEAQIRNGPL